MNTPRFELLKTAIDVLEIVEDAINVMADENAGTTILVEGHEWTIGQWRDALKVHIKAMLSNLKCS